MKKIVQFSALVLSVLVLVACREADRVSHNLSKEADNFNIVRKITVINAIQGEILYQMTGKMSIHHSAADQQLEIIAQDDNGGYKKHFIGLSDNVTYVVEDITGADVSNTKYTITFNPDMVIPLEVQPASDQ